MHHWRTSLLALFVLLFGNALTTPVLAQCILANPSFEILGSGGEVLGGWNHFGVVGWVPEADHGSKAARVSGPNSGSWEVSGFWQSQDCVPGEQWDATGHVQHPSGKPLTGQSTAIVNIEWRDAGDNLLDYESFTVADLNSPTDTYFDFQIFSGPAPAGTAKVRFLLGVLQSPTDPSPDVYYDQVTFYSTSSPTIDNQQWNDFPGGTTLEFSGYSWRVKGPGLYGPGNNRFCNFPSCVWVDAQDRLHLTVQYLSGNWYSTEVTTEDALGYGDYILTTQGRLDLLDPQIVLGIFPWQYGPCWDDGYLWWNPYNEIDIEYSRWGNPSSDIGQFVAQPYNYPGNINRFDAAFSDGEIVSHAMRWLSDRVEYRVWRGGPDDESAANMIHSWIYTGPHIPRPEQPRMHLNLWKLDGTPASDQEVVFEGFRFVPEGGPTAVAEDLIDRLPANAPARLHPAVPNPFNPRTVIRFELRRDEFARLDVYDVSGRHVRSLLQQQLSAGIHQALWNGVDDEGLPVASGVYLVRLSGIDFSETQRVSLIK